MIAAETFARLANPQSSHSEIEELLHQLSGEELDALSLQHACRVLGSLIDPAAARAASAIKDTGTDLVDCSGTGGSGLPHFNTSTTVAFVLAAGGLHVAKFGNRAASSKCGSFDLLDAMGYPTRLSVSRIPDLLTDTGLAFLFAPAFYPCLQRLTEIRKKLNKRTILNYLGPLLNPVQPAYRLMGISNRTVVEPVARVLAANPRVTRALLVNSARGLDELDCQGVTYLTSVQGGSISTSVEEGSKILSLVESRTAARRTADELSPKAETGSGVQEASDETSTIEGNLRSFTSIVSGTENDTAEFKLVVLNAGAAFFIAGGSSSIQEGCHRAFELLKSGKVQAHFEKCRRIYERFSR